MGGVRRHALFRYATAVVVVIVAARIMTIPAIAHGEGTPILVLFGAILVSAWVGGLGPGLLTTGLIFLLTLPPSLPLSRAIRHSLFFACGATISGLVGALHASRRRAEAGAEALGKSEERLRLLLESITDHAIFTIDREGRVTSWSTGAERVLGYAAAEILGRPSDLLYTEEEIAHGEPARERAVALIAGRLESECWRVRKDGKRIWASGVITPLSDGETGGLTWVVRDITRQKAAEAELRRALEAVESASRTKDQFLAALSHELRTPLTPALVGVSELLDDPETSGTIRPALEVVRRNIMLEARLIDDLLDMTRISRGKLRLSREVVDVHDLVRRTVEICRDDIETAGLGLRLDLAAAESSVQADPARLQQVLWNLIKNAVKFTPRWGSIQVRSRNEGSPSEEAPGGRLVVEVIDTGIGIEPAVLPRIFNAFDQGHPEMTQQFGGLGLGLAISRSLAESHGGRLSASSAGKGRGATFRLELPTTRPAREETTPTMTGRPAAPSPGSLRVLLVEDNADTLRLMTRLFLRRGYLVTPAADLATALEAARERAFDLVISDLGLPDGSGLDLMRQLRSRSPVKGIALSGYGMEDDYRKSREAGFALHLIKPVDFHTLEDAIRRVCLASFEPTIGP